MTRQTPFNRLRQFANVLFAVTQVAVTLLPQWGWGSEIGEQSDAVRTDVTPAGYAFAIWGPIYLGCFIYAWHQLWRPADPRLRRLGWLSACAFLGNTLWVLWVQFVRIEWTAFIIIASTTGVMIGSLIVLRRRPAVTGRDWWCVDLPLSALAGWLSVALFANFSATLKSTGCTWFHIPEEWFSAILLVLAGHFTIAATHYFHNRIFGSLAGWGLLGIAIGNWSTPAGIAAAVSAILIASLLTMRSSSAHRRQRVNLQPVSP